MAHPAVDRLRRVAADVDVDPDAAERAVADLTDKAGLTEATAADALCQQLDAGVGLDAAVEALVRARR